MLLLASTFIALSSIVLVNALTGEVTFYTPGLGACGETNTENDYIAAMAFGTFDTFEGGSSNPNNNPICNKRLKATYQGKSVVVKIVDRCAGCMLPNNVDMSPIAFRELADQSVGRLYGVEWEWTDSEPGPASAALGSKAKAKPKAVAPPERRVIGESNPEAAHAEKRYTVSPHERKMIKRRRMEPDAAGTGSVRHDRRSYNEPNKERGRPPITPDRRRAMERRGSGREPKPTTEPREVLTGVHGMDSRSELESGTHIPDPPPNEGGGKVVRSFGRQNSGKRREIN